MTTTAVAVGSDVVSALHALNTHARAYGCGKRAIYRYKTLVAALLVHAGEASAQLVQWTGTCGHCGGTGRYVDSCGYRFPHCRQCSSTGRATLKFVETTLPDGVAWHHPWTNDQGGIEIADLAGLARWRSTEPYGWYSAKGHEAVFWNVASNWQPRQPAERLVPDDVAAHLNVVEAWVLASVLPPSNTLHWMRERALREMRDYVIDLGRCGLGCWYCGSPEIVSGLSRPGPPFSWSASVCPLHRGVDVASWPAPNALPQSTLTPPLLEWKQRHATIGFDRETIFGWL